MLVKTILVVDDDKAIRNYLYLTLNTAGYEVITACDGREAVEILQEQAPTIDLVVLDLDLPDMSGEHIARALRKDKAGWLIPILYCTEATSFKIARGLMAGARAVDFVLKPFKAGELLTRTQVLLDYCELQRVPFPVNFDQSAVAAVGELVA